MSNSKSGLSVACGEQIAERHGFQTPLDEMDAAARVVDPILSVANGGEPLHGKFLKDYQPCEW